MKTIAQQLNITDFPFIIRDSKDNQTYCEDSDGWCKYEYDSNGNRTYFETSYGYWSKSEYDANGNQTYCEDSYGSWLKYEYDSNGKEIYYENSEGEIIDNRPRPSREG